MNQRICLALDLKNDPECIQEYKEWHKEENSWPEVTQSMKESGIIDMEIYLIENRLFMVIEANGRFKLSHNGTDEKNSKIIEWEKMMDKYQMPLPTALPHEKWLQMNLIYKLPKK